MYLFNRGPRPAGWPWIRTSTGGVTTSSESSVALFPTHSNCPEARRWEASTGEERRVGLKRWRREAGLIPKHVCLGFVWASGVWSKMESQPSSETLSQVPAPSNRTFCSDVIVLCLLSSRVATNHMWLLDTWSVTSATEQLDFILQLIKNCYNSFVEV